MRCLKLLCSLALVMPTLEIPVVAQTTFEARAMASYRRGVMFRIEKMSDPGEISGCNRLVLSGSVESAEYDDRNEITKFSMKTQRGETRTINLPKGLYQQLPSEAEMGLSKLLVKGRRIRVVAYRCDASTRVLEADDIRAL